MTNEQKIERVARAIYDSIKESGDEFSYYSLHPVFKQKLISMARAAINEIEQHDESVPLPYEVLNVYDFQ